jgi:hypothetical protein
MKPGGYKYLGIMESEHFRVLKCQPSGIPGLLLVDIGFRMPPEKERAKAPSRGKRFELFRQMSLRPGFERFMAESGFSEEETREFKALLSPRFIPRNQEKVLPFLKHFGFDLSDEELAALPLEDILRFTERLHGFPVLLSSFQKHFSVSPFGRLGRIYGKMESRHGEINLHHKIFTCMGGPNQTWNWCIMSKESHNRIHRMVDPQIRDMVPGDSARITIPYPIGPFFALADERLILPPIRPKEKSLGKFNPPRDAPHHPVPPRDIRPALLACFSRGSL